MRIQTEVYQSFQRRIVIAFSGSRGRYDRECAKLYARHRESYHETQVFNR